MNNQILTDSEPQASITVSVAKSKKPFKKIIVLTMVVVALVSAVFIIFNKSDEEKILDKLDDFASAFNSGDSDAMVKCLDKRSQSALKGMIGVSSAVIKQGDNFFSGLFKEDENLLSDIFGLSVGATEAQLTIEVIDITFISDKKAKIEANLIYTDNYLYENTDIDKETFIMVKEKSDWYIVEDFKLF